MMRFAICSVIILCFLACAFPQSAHATLNLNGVFDIAVSGDYMYATTNDKIHIFDISEPENPVYLDFFKIINDDSIQLKQLKDIEISGNFAYVASQNPNSGFSIIDISNPHKLQIVNSVYIDEISPRNPNSNVKQISISGNFAYLALTGDHTVLVLDISNPNEIETVDLLEDGWRHMIFGLSDMAMIENNLYIVSGESQQLLRYDVSNPENIDDGTSLHMYLHTSPGILDIATSGNYVYLTAYRSDQLQVIDVTNPYSMQRVDFLDDRTGLLKNPHGIFVSDGYAYVISQYSNALQIIDISNPHNITPMGSVQVDFTINSMAENLLVLDNIAYATLSGNDTIAMFDVTNPDEPIYLGTMEQLVTSLDVENLTYTASPESIYITWDAPRFDGGLGIDGYAIFTYCIEDGEIILHNPDELITDFKFLIKGLKAEEKYDVLVLPINEINYLVWETYGQ